MKQHSALYEILMRELERPIEEKIAMWRAENPGRDEDEYWRIFNTPEPSSKEK